MSILGRRFSIPETNRSVCCALHAGRTDGPGLRPIDLDRAVSGCERSARVRRPAAMASTFATDSGVHGAPRIALQIVSTNSFAVPSLHPPEGELRA